MTSTKQIDWMAIEAAYRAGSFSVRAIAEVHGITHAAISKRANKEGWQRDLTEKVRAAAKAKVAKGITNGGNRLPLVTDEQIIEDASDAAAAIVISHRSGLARWRVIADKLCYALSDLDVCAENLTDFSRALNSGVDAQLKVIKGERQAYNLDAEVEAEGSRMEDVLRELIARMPG